MGLLPPIGTELSAGPFTTNKVDINEVKAMPRAPADRNTNTGRGNGRFGPSGCLSEAELGAPGTGRRHSFTALIIAAVTVATAPTIATIIEVSIHHLNSKIMEQAPQPSGETSKKTLPNIAAPTTVLNGYHCSC
jgi:hypothetical protein